jgi:uncharacterized membrane protein YccC
VLRRQAERILDRLRNEAKPLPEPQVSWVAVEPAVWAAEIEPALAELVAALRAVYADRRRAETTFRREQEAIDEHNRTYAAVTSILSGLYRLAKLDIYEERLRPTVPQSGAIDEELLEDEPVPINENEVGSGGRAPPFRARHRHRLGGKSTRNQLTPTETIRTVRGPLREPGSHSRFMPSPPIHWRPCRIR